ncbi:hypothetical protein GEMRC1_004331 [Eukaryota sp. GEM-RC1]
MRLFTLFLLFAVCVLAGDHFQSCSGPSAVLDIESFSIEPYHITLGKNVTIRGVGELKTVITDGAVANVSVYFNRSPLFNKTFDLCKDAKDYGLPIKCPILPSSGHVQSLTFELPEFVRVGHYTGRLNSHLADGTEIICVDFDFWVWTQPITN